MRICFLGLHNKKILRLGQLIANVNIHKLNGKVEKEEHMVLVKIYHCKCGKRWGEILTTNNRLLKEVKEEKEIDKLIEAINKRYPNRRELIC